MRRLPLFLIAVSIAVGAHSLSAQAFLDTADSPYEENINALRDYGILEGYADGTFRPDAPVNRAELMKVLIETAFPGMNEPATLRCFDDFPLQETPWYAGYVCSAKERGIVGGYPDGTFRPADTVNLAEALKMTALTFGVHIDATAGAWYEPYIDAARERGALPDLLDDPAHLLTRGEVAGLIHAFLMREAEDNENGGDEQEDEQPQGPAMCGNGILEQGEQCDDGNLENEDGCSMICIITPVTIRHGSLLITQEATATVTNVAAGKQGVTLLRFNATAGRQDVLLTRLVLEPSLGSLVYAKNFTLAMDRDGDGVFESMVPPAGKADGQRLIFDGFDDGGVLLHEGLTVPFEIRADISQSLGPFSFGLRFDEDHEQFIGAVGAVDGRELTNIETENNPCTGNAICWIRVVTAQSGEISVTGRGNLYVTDENDLVRNRQILAGTTTDAVFRFRFRAEREDIDVSMIRFEGGLSSISSLLLYEEGSLTPFTQATTSQCGGGASATRFCADLPSRVLVIPANTEKTILVRASLLSDVSGGMSGQQFTLSMTDASSGAPAVEALGIASTQTLRQNDNDGTADGEIFIGRETPGSNAAITGKQHVTAFAGFADIVNGGQASGGAVPTGQRDIGSFRFTASPHLNSKNGLNQVRLRSLQFSVQALNVQLDPLSIRLAAKETPNVYVTCTGGQTTGSFTVTCGDLAASSVPRSVSQGSSLTLVLSANITNPQLQPGTSSLFVSIPSLGFPGQPGAVTWDDEATTFDWIDLPKTSVQSTEFRSGF